MKVDYKLVKRLITESEIEKALDQLAIETKGTEHSMEVTMLTARHLRLSRDTSKGILDTDDIRREENQILDSLLDLLERLETDFVTNRIVYQSVQFFESAFDHLPEDNEQVNYTNVFPTEKTRCVAWVMTLLFPLTPAEFDAVYEWIILSEGQPIMAKQQVELTFPKDWDYLTYTDLWGAEQYGVWEKGKYVLEIYCKNKMVATGEFAIT
jgi:hypothetical protein